ncbi:MAG: ankyrin repeat domain-containing protein, partial [Proteobacteria bacterium]|nr:ankyrin repeat domain-containing protein [Pseudomonadota bacterium]
LEAVRVILDQGGNANAPLPTWDRKSPLHVAAEAKRSDVASLLLDRGADPNALDASGRSPLYDAVVLGREDNVRVLLERGADPNLAPPGDTTLRAARAESLRKLLRDYGARD